MHQSGQTIKMVEYVPEIMPISSGNEKLKIDSTLLTTATIQIIAIASSVVIVVFTVLDKVSLILRFTSCSLVIELP